MFWARHHAVLLEQISLPEEEEMNIEVGGILGFILLICIIYAVVKTVQSRASTGTKVIWIAVLLLLPLLGFIFWLIFGPKG